MPAMTWRFISSGLSIMITLYGLVGAVGASAAEPPAAKTVFLVCEGQFRIQQETGIESAPEEFEGALYVSINYTDDQFNEIILQPFERDERLRSQHFVPTRPAMAAIENATDENGIIPDATEVRIEATQDEVLLHQTRASGATVRARVDGEPLVPTRMRIETVDLSLNRFSGRMRAVWGARHVREEKPVGAIRAVKVSYLDRKSFDAKCHTMKERLF